MADKAITQDELMEIVKEAGFNYKLLEYYGHTTATRSMLTKFAQLLQQRLSTQVQSVQGDVYISDDMKLPHNIHFASGSIGKGCSFRTLIMSLEASQNIIKDLIQENRDMYAYLGLPTTIEKALQANKDGKPATFKQLVAQQGEVAKPPAIDEMVRIVDQVATSLEISHINSICLTASAKTLRQAITKVK